MINSAELKVGDSIIVTSGNNSYLTKVAKITPTGRVRIERFPYAQFDQNGEEMGNHSWWRWKLEEATDERLRQIKEKKTLRAAYALMENCGDLTYEQAVKIIDILGGDKH